MRRGRATIRRHPGATALAALICLPALWAACLFWTLYRVS